MKNFVIILKNHDKSEKFGNISISSGIDLGWNISRFDGIDGRTTSVHSLFDSFNLKVNNQNKKCKNLLEKPGVKGCFLSHWSLWNMCLELNEPIGIFEDDILFLKPPVFSNDFPDILKLDKLKQGKRYAAGDWWEGAHAYVLKPSGAKKLINWSRDNGILPADMMLGTEILKVDFDYNNLVRLNPESQIDLNTQSLTKSL
jgi:GR25 family glycosyltransferase involved in LPS biosynthesis